MYTVTIYDKSKKHFKTYYNIHTIKYFDQLIECDWITIMGNDILSHHFPLNCTYQLLSDSGNYSIDAAIIGTFEIESE